MLKKCFHKGVDRWCSSCDGCHACAEGEKPDARQEQKIPDVPGVSQKARGLGVLSLFANNALRINALIRTEEDIKKAQSRFSSYYFPMFARPCPVRPRHGFVDSRVVKNWDGVRLCLKETLDADPEGEVMILPYVEATHNSIWTPTLLTVGKGHDGATSGKDCVMIPIVPPKVDYTRYFRAAGIKEGDGPYIEAVHQDRSTHLVQLRAGTPLAPNCSLDFLPREVLVGEVIKTNGEDLLAWEAITIELMKREDVIVWHPGGSLTDHYSVHCRERGIPIAITYQPLEGEVLVPVNDLTDDMVNIDGEIRYIPVVAAARPNPEDVLRGVYIGERVKLTPTSAYHAVGVILLGLHFSPVMTGEHGKWIGIASALMCRLGSIACLGEARHWHGSPNKGKNRDTVYDETWNKSLQFHKGGLSRLANIFRYGQFGSSSFGGKNWAMCAFALAPIFSAISKLARDKSDDAVSELVLALNIAVNQAHNGGWWLNKFNHGNLLDTIQAGDFEAVLSCAPFIYEAGKLSETITEVPATVLARWQRWGDVAVKPLPVQSVSMFVVPGIPAVQLAMTPGSPFKALGERRVVIPFAQMRDRPLKDDDLYLVTGPSGWMMQAMRGQDKVTLWEDEPFTVQARKIVNGAAVN